VPSGTQGYMEGGGEKPKGVKMEGREVPIKECFPITGVDETLLKLPGAAEEHTHPMRL
jgi:hypothetical protein